VVCPAATRSGTQGPALVGRLYELCLNRLACPVTCPGLRGVGLLDGQATWSGLPEDAACSRHRRFRAACQDREGGTGRAGRRQPDSSRLKPGAPGSAARSRRDSLGGRPGKHVLGRALFDDAAVQEHGHLVAGFGTGARWGFAVGGVVSPLIALCYAELSACFPLAGGDYTLVSRRLVPRTAWPSSSSG
jgi:hypothetical protein